MSSTSSKVNRMSSRKRTTDTIEVVRKPSSIIIKDDSGPSNELSALSATDIEKRNATLHILIEKRKQPLSNGVAALIAAAREKDNSIDNILSKKNIGRLMMVFFVEEPEVYEVVDTGGGGAGGGGVKARRVPVDMDALRKQVPLCLDLRQMDVATLVKLFG